MNFPRWVFYFGCGLLTFLSLLPQDLVIASGVSDKVEHAFAYAVLVFCGLTAYPSLCIRVGSFLFIYGIGLEFVQSFVPGRVPSSWDVIANAAGIGVGILIFHFSKCQKKPASFLKRPEVRRLIKEKMRITSE